MESQWTKKFLNGFAVQDHNGISILYKLKRCVISWSTTYTHLYQIGKKYPQQTSYVVSSNPSEKPLIILINFLQILNIYLSELHMVLFS